MNSAQHANKGKCNMKDFITLVFSSKFTDQERIIIIGVETKWFLETCVEESKLVFNFIHSNSIFRFYTTETFRKLIFYKASMKFIEFR
jgi:hypothetical protein